MNCLQKVVTHSIMREKELKKLCSPLQEYFDIPIFTYFRIQNDGTFVTLTTAIEQLEYYYQEKFYQVNPFLVHPDLIHSGCVVTKKTNDPAYLETISASERRFFAHNPFLIITKSMEQLEGFYFAAVNEAVDIALQY